MAAEAPIRPADYVPAPELLLITDAAEELLKLPEANCYFNPNGETLFTAHAIATRRAHYARQRMLPLDIWCNIRNLRQDEPGWSLMDIVGMQQLDLPDQEAYAPTGYSLNDVGVFLANISLYQSGGPVIEKGNTTNGPGGNWRVLAAGQSKTIPPRPVLRWFPDKGLQPPQSFLI